MKQKLRMILIAAIPILLCIIAVSVRVAVPKSSTVTIDGDIEVEVRPYYVQATGEVRSIPVGVGEHVSAGAVLAVLDDSQAQYELKQLEISRARAQAALRDLKQTDNEKLKAAQIRIARNNVAIAEENLTAAEDGLAKLGKDAAALQALFDAGLAAQSELDEMTASQAAQETAVAVASAQLGSAREQLVIAGLDTEPDLTEKMAMAQADIDSLDAQIAHAKSQLDHYTVRALDDGVVISLSCDEGGLALSGTQICELSRENNRKFVFYLPEEYIDYVDYGRTITVTGQSMEQGETPQQYAATVQYIDLKAQYTPKAAESSANKNRLSFKVEALLPPDCAFRVAQKASITFGE